jgi:hypothetical protein
MMHRIACLIVVLVVCLSWTVGACSFFSYAGDDRVLFGNSEDHRDENTWIWYVPSTANEYGCLFLGFGTEFAQGGVNSAGLAFDAAGIERAPLNDHPELPMPDPLNFCEIVLRRCATIDEAIDLMASYNLSYVQSAQFQFTDRTGASVVVAPGPNQEIAFIRSEDAFQVTTNTNTAIYPRLYQTCSRHRRITKALEKIDAGTLELSIERFATILASVASVSGTSETMYSNVFELTNGLAYVYHRHDFEKVAVLDVVALEAAGKAVAYRIVELVSAE